MKKPLPPFLAIRALRKELGLSQRELAERAGVSQQWIAFVEQGVQVTDDMKRKLASALDISVWAIWPEVPMTVDLFRILKNRWGSDLEISEREVPFVKEVLSRLSEDEFDELLWSGTDPKDLWKILEKFAETYNIEYPQAKK